MEEKFYYSRKVVKERTLLQVAFLIMSFLIFLIFLGRVFDPPSFHSPSWWEIALCLFSFLFLIYNTSLLDRWLKAIDSPVVMISDRKVTYIPVKIFGKREADLDKIVSIDVSDIGESIVIKYKKPNNEIDSFDIENFHTIDNYERLIEVLKQRIKFV